jgi:quercetin dioxygenase-like cupin family protein
MIMKTTNHNSKSVHLVISRSLSALLMSFDLPVLIEKMKNTPSWRKGELNAMVLVKNPVKQIVLTVLHAGTEIRSFQSDDSVSFQIIDGKLRFHTHKESIVLDNGQLLLFREKAGYRLTSMEDTVLLLTITKYNYPRN